jgi:hypothetical protein
LEWQELVRSVFIGVELNFIIVSVFEMAMTPLGGADDAPRG